MSNLATEMQMVFGLPPRFWACTVMIAQGYWAIDTVRLEQGLEMITHQRITDGESLRDFIQQRYGDDAVALVERGIKGEAVQA